MRLRQSAHPSLILNSEMGRMICWKIPYKNPKMVGFGGYTVQKCLVRFVLSKMLAEDGSILRHRSVGRT